MEKENQGHGTKWGLKTRPVAKRYILNTSCCYDDDDDDDVNYDIIDSGDGVDEHGVDVNDDENDDDNDDDGWWWW